MYHRPQRTCWDPRFVVSRFPQPPPPELRGPTLAEVIAANRLVSISPAKIHHSSSPSTHTYIDDETGEIFDCPPAPPVS